jgi:hypothetical protein
MDLKVFLLKTDRKTGTRTVGIIIRSAIPRAGYEKKLLPGIEVGLPGWQRAHVVGPGFGFEDKTIFYAPANFNLSYQGAGVERHIRELYALKAPDVEIRVTVEARPFKSTLKLEEITYKVEFVKEKRRHTYYELTLKIGDAVNLNPRIENSIIHGSAYYNIEEFLAKPSPPKGKVAASKSSRSTAAKPDKPEKDRRSAAPQTDARRRSRATATDSTATEAKTILDTGAGTDARATRRVTPAIRNKSLEQLIKYGQSTKSAIGKYQQVAQKWSIGLFKIHSFIDTATNAIETVLSAQQTGRQLAGLELSAEAKIAYEIELNAKSVNEDANQILDDLLDSDFTELFMQSLQTTDRTEMLFIKEPLISFKHYVTQIRPRVTTLIPQLKEKIVLLQILKHKVVSLMNDRGYLTATTALYVAMGGDTATLAIGLLRLKVTTEHMIGFLQSALDTHLQTLPTLESIEDHASFFEQQVTERTMYLSDHNQWTGPGLSFTN